MTETRSPTVAGDAPATTPHLGPTVGGRWRLGPRLGQGGMADVYRATDELDGGRPVAVKLLRSSDPALARRLAREAAALESFEHPNLVRLLGTGVDDGRPYLVTELVEGPTLAARLRRGPLLPSEAATVGAALGSGLAYVHGRGVVHRDLKPANVLLGPGSRVRLADFGIARLVDQASMTGTDTTLGTTAYMAPEQLHDREVGPAADVWSLGLVLLEGLTGRTQFAGTAGEVMARRLNDGVRLPGDLPGPWRLLLAAMLDDDVSRRPTAADVAGMVVAPGFSARWRASGGKDTAGPDGRVDGAVPASTRLDTGAGATRITAAPPLVRATRHSWQRMGAGILACMVVLGLLAWALSGPTGPAPHGAAATRPSVHRPAAPEPTVANAAAALVRDVQAGVGAHSVVPSAAAGILGEVDQLLAAVDGDGGPAAIGPDLGMIDSSVAGGAANGTIAPREASILAGDVSRLAATLRAPTIATTTTTAPPPTPGPPGHGKHASGPDDQG